MKHLNRTFISLLVAFFVLSCCFSSYAEIIELKSLSYEELLDLREAVYKELTSRPEGMEYNTWDGNNKVSIYEDDVVLIEFAGLYAWTDDWYIPNIIVTNKTDSTIGFEWNNVYLNGCKVGAANSRKDEIPVNGKMSLASVKHCSITLKDDFIDIYGEYIINSIEMDFSVYDLDVSDNEALDSGKCGVLCSIDLTELFG